MYPALGTAGAVAAVGRVYGCFPVRDTFTRLAEGAGRDTLLGRALGAVVDVLAFIPGGPARVLLALALLTAATVSGAALLLRGSVRQTA